MADRTAPASLLPVQGLVNTLDVETGADTLTADGGLDAFLAAHGLPPLAPEDGGPAAVRALTELREALRAVCLAHTAGGGPAAADARTLDRLLARAPLVLAVAPDGTTALRPAAGLRGADRLTALLAAGIATAAADGTWTRLKACEAHDCRWVFYDRSPAGRGRWCAMAVCGSRAKMRSYRARRAESG
ncbi:CGNR zinc finger domain-containing protein [Streptomyces sp. NPDC059080]|uniref:CGNR zinc finger domain-containing protein n=1 Tax=Streptomyces sp. NPDC059080 TaxID=3346718 RepID=UPI0036776FCB